MAAVTSCSFARDERARASLRHTSAMGGQECRKSEAWSVVREIVHLISEVPPREILKVLQRVAQSGFGFGHSFGFSFGQFRWQSQLPVLVSFALI